MVNKGGKALHELRTEVASLELLDFYEKNEPRVFFILYISKRILADVWKNLATDATLDYPEKGLDSFAQNFGRFIRASLSGDSAKGLDYLSKAIIEYFSLLSKLNKSFSKGG